MANNIGGGVKSRPRVLGTLIYQGVKVSKRGKTISSQCLTYSVLSQRVQRIYRVHLLLCKCMTYRKCLYSASCKMQGFHLFQSVHQPNNRIGNNVYVIIWPGSTLWVKVLLGRRNNGGAFASTSYAGTVTCVCNKKN